eukprot:2972536-Prymnesium_polylepis.1
MGPGRSGSPKCKNATVRTALCALRCLRKRNGVPNPGGHRSGRRWGVKRVSPGFPHRAETELQCSHCFANMIFGYPDLAFLEG